MTSSFSSPPSRIGSERSSLPSSVSEAIRDEGRLEALEKQDILDTEPEPAFDRIARLAADILDTELALVNFVSEDRQWFKSAVGFDKKETGLDVSFCVFTIEKGETMVVEDLGEDERFAENPYVTEGGVRFYAGVPLETEDGHRIGTLCVLDIEPHAPSDKALRQLSDLAAMVEDELELRKEKGEHQRARRDLEESQEVLRHAEELAEVGGWMYDPQAEELSWTSQTYRIHDLPPSAKVNVNDALGFYTEESRPVLESHFERLMEEGGSYDLELTIKTAEGEPRRIRTIGRAHRSGEETTRIDGAIQDITEQWLQWETLESRKANVRALYETVDRLFQASSPKEVGDALIEIIRNALGYEGVSVRFAREDQLEVTHVAESTFAFMPERPDFPIDGKSVVAEIYRTGETLVIEDLGASDLEPNYDYGDLRSVVVVTMGEHGLFSVASPEPGAIDDFDKHLIEVLAVYASLVLDLLEREENLREAKEAAEEAARIKTALLSNMNHELRTPLTSIISFAELIDENPDIAAQFTDRILGGGKRLLYTLNTVMEFAELEGQDYSVEPRLCQLGDAVRSLANGYRGRARQKGMKLEVDVSQASSAHLDVHLVERVLTHLLHNAVKFTEEGAVTVQAKTLENEEGETEVELTVSDTGMGIDPEFLPKVFDEFAQASTGFDRTHEGNGLGLTVAKRFVNRMNGKIDLESEPGEGTTVTVQLPCDS